LSEKVFPAKIVKNPENHYDHPNSQDAIFFIFEMSGKNPWTFSSS